MKQFLFMVVLTFFGLAGTLVRGPIIAVALYYLYTVLRPQYLWKFPMSAYPEIGWTFYASLGALLSYLPWVFGVIDRHDPLRRVFPKFVWTHRMMVGFGIWQTLSYLNANDQYRAYPYYEEFLKIFVMYILTTQVVRSFGQVHLLYMMITGALAYISFDVVQNYLMTGYLVFYKRGFAGLDNNGAALMVAMGIPLCYFTWEFTKGWYRWIFLAAIPVIGEAVMSSYSRGAMLASLCALPFYFLYTRKRKEFMIMMAIGAVTVPIVAGEEIQERFGTMLDEKEDGSYDSRKDSWRAARLIANDYPVFGAGIRCSNLISKDYGADLEGRTIHDQYLQIAADSGWVGLAWYLAFLGTGFYMMWLARRRLWHEKDPESVRAVAMLGGLECSLIVFLAGAVFLSLEMFEPPYMVVFLGAQIYAIMKAEVAPPPRVRVGVRQVGPNNRIAPGTRPARGFPAPQPRPRRELPS